MTNYLQHTGSLASVCVCNRLNHLKEHIVLQGFMAGYGVCMTPFRAAVFLNLLTGIVLFLHILKGLIAGVCPLKMYGLFAVIYLGAVFTSSAEIRA